MSLIHRSELEKLELIVVKVGSKILTPQSANEHIERISSLVRNMSDIIDSGIKVVFISSGAVAHGRLRLGLTERPKSIPMKQACAGVGQIELMNIYRDCFSKYDKHCGQILLTWDDLREKSRYLNLRNTLFTMLENNIIPIINENDSIGVEEIGFGDNDTLAAQIAMVTNADLFMTLTDINGLYTANPKKDADATHIPLVESFNDALRSMADADGNDVGTGGMVTKIRAAEMVNKAGVAAIIGDGYDNELVDIINNKNLGTLFLTSNSRMGSKKRFLAFTDNATGTITIDDGAKEALIDKGKSLLPAGIISVDGEFYEGDTVNISNRGKVVARGIVNYSSSSVELIKGHKSSEIEKLIGANDYGVVVHRNNMAVLG